MQGKIYKTDDSNFYVLFVTNNQLKGLPLLPETNTTDLQTDMEVHFEEVVKLKTGATYTATEGWNVDPVEEVYARLVWSPTLYTEVEQAAIRWSNDGTRTAGDLTREILALVEKYKS